MTTPELPGRATHGPRPPSVEAPSPGAPRGFPPPSTEGRDSIRPLLLLHEAPVSFASTLRPLAELAATLGVPSVVVGRPGDGAAECGVTEDTRHLRFDTRRPFPPRQEGRLPLLSPTRARAFARGVRYWRTEARRLMEEHDPRAILSVKRTFEDVPRLTRLARERGIPFVRVQWSFIMPQALHDRQAPIRLLAQLQGAGRIRKAGHLLRGRIMRTVGARMIPEVSPPASASPGVTAFAATNRLFRDMFVAEGLDPRTTLAVGHPEDDLLWRLRGETSDPSRIRDLRSRLGWSSHRTVVLVVRTFLQSLGGLVTREDDLAAVAEIVAAATQGGAQVVVRPHPKESAADLAELQARFPPIVLDTHGDPFLSVAAADVVVSQGSGMTRWGVVLEKPTLLVDFAALEFVQYASELYRVPVARSPEEVRSSLGRMLKGDRLVAAEATGPVCELVDGEACRRVLALAGIGAPPDPLREGDTAGTPQGAGAGGLP